MEHKARRLPIELIVLSPYARERRLPSVDPRALELARETDIVTPAVVRSIGHPGYPRYELLSGAEGWAIAQHLCLPSIPVVILEGLNESEVREYVEAHERWPYALGDGEPEARGMDPLAWAEEALRHIDEERRRRGAYSQKEAARVLGVDHTSLSHGLRMLRRLRGPARAALKNGAISLGHAKALTAFSGAEQDRIVEGILIHHASVRKTEEAAAAYRAGAGATIGGRFYKRDLDLARLEERITAVTGVPATIHYDNAKRKGSVTLAFADLDAFDTILDRLGVTYEED